MDVAVLDGILNFLQGLSLQYPVLVSVFAILYTVGIAFKILFSALDEFIVKSPNKKDDEILSKIKENKIFKAVFFVIDLLVRIKVK